MKTQHHLFYYCNIIVPVIQSIYQSLCFEEDKGTLNEKEYDPSFWRGYRKRGNLKEIILGYTVSVNYILGKS